jgi:hypothetical protein
MLALWALPYLTMILLFNDVAFARYAFPLVAGLCLLGGWEHQRDRAWRCGPWQRWLPC